MDEMPHPSPARFFATNFLLWLLGALMAALAVAGLSVQLQSAGFAPVVLFSLLLGGALGGALALLARLTRAGHRRSVIAATVLLAGVTVVGQHAIAYLRYRAAYEESLANDPKAALAKAFSPEMGPAGFGRYMQSHARGGSLWHWYLDAALIIGTATAIVFVALRTPYCNGCRSWYRAVRLGQLDGPAAARVAAQCDIPAPSNAGGAGFRILACRTGCGPVGFELSWSSGQDDERLTCRRVWISQETRREIESAIDQA